MPFLMTNVQKEISFVVYHDLQFCSLPYRDVQISIGSSKEPPRRPIMTTFTKQLPVILAYAPVNEQDKDYFQASNSIYQYFHTSFVTVFTDIINGHSFRGSAIGIFNFYEI